MGIAKKLDHIGIAVPNIDDYLRVFSDVLELPCTGRETVADQQVTAAFLELGDTRIELLEPTADTSPIAKFLAAGGGKPRFHHLAVEVEDVEAALRQARDNGVRLVDESPRTGAHGQRIAFLHPKSTAGVLLELCQPSHDPGTD